MMKKLFISLLIVLASCTMAMAQNESYDELADKLELSKTVGNDVFSLEFLSNMRVGHIMTPTSNKYLSGRFMDSSEVEFNAFEARVNATDWASLCAGVNVKFDTFKADADNYYFDLDQDRKTVVYPVGLLSSLLTNKEYSEIGAFAIGVPVNLKLSTGKISLKLGGEALFYITTATETSSISKANGIDRRSIVNARGGRPESFVWTWVGELNFNGIGIYYRYCPNPAFSCGDMNLVYHTIGIVLGR